MPPSGKRSRIIQELALWAAVSAPQDISVRGRKLYPFRREVDLAVVLDVERCSTGVEFQAWHHEQVVSLARAASIEVGWAAKLVNMLLKALVYIGSKGHQSLLIVIHPPIDNSYDRRVAEEADVQEQEAVSRPSLRVTWISLMTLYFRLTPRRQSR
jgi:hypothetical protein